MVKVRLVANIGGVLRPITGEVKSSTFYHGEQVFYVSCMVDGKEHVGWWGERQLTFVD
jgi:hypothetical protein